MSVECLKFKSHQIGSLVGFVDLWIPKMGLEIYGCSLYQKDGARWLNFPSKEFKDPKTGDKKYSSIVRFRNGAHMDAFTDAVKQAIDEWCKENSKIVPDKPVIIAQDQIQAPF